MIHYMPFTFIGDDRIRRLASVIGPFAVCQLAPVMVPAGIQARAAQGLVTVQYPRQLNADRLQSAIREYQQWGGLHEGRLATVAGLYRANPLPHAMDDRPTQISTLIRRYGYPDGDEGGGLDLFQAALFLAMAQLYDEQQASIAENLTTVQRLEALMISQLSGDTTVSAGHGAAAPSTAFQADEPDPGGVFSSQRLEAWALLAAQLEQPADLYVTCSRAVHETILEACPEAIALGVIPLHQADPDATLQHPLDTALHAIATAGEPSKIALDRAAVRAQDNASAMLTLHVLPGRRPYEVLARLAHRIIEDPWPDSDLKNTVIGYVAMATA